MKNVARFRKLIKKILRTFCIWGIITMMVIPTLAVEDIETIPLHRFIGITWLDENAETAKVRAYDYPSGGDVLPTSSSSQPSFRGMLAYESAIDKNTFYHMRFQYEKRGTTSNNWLQDKATGVITDQGGEITTVMLPATRLSPYLQMIDESEKQATEKTIEWSYEAMNATKVTSYVGAKAYYYFTKTSTGMTIDVLMYFNDEFFQYGWNFEASRARYMQCYIGVIMPIQGDFRLTGYDLYEVGGSDYNGKLDQIIALLQTQGGGLTEEDIKHATVEALRQHEQEEQQQAQQGTQDAKQQAEQAMARYTEVMEQMKTAMAGIEDIKNIDTSTYTLTIGPFTNPMTGGVFPAVGVDFYTAYQGMPAILKSTCPIVVTFFVLMAYAREFLDIFKHVEKTMHGEDEQ